MPVRFVDSLKIGEIFVGWPVVAPQASRDMHNELLWKVKIKRPSNSVSSKGSVVAQ